MPDHKFKAGQTVRILPSRYITGAQGSFKIIRLLPAERGMNQYRIKSSVDGHERVVMEHELG
ncbi:MAG TPA: hypothetical protein VFA50_05220 [Stellaceae bacterium]|nr:hypothetical protein [Stellaceae bacterium]